MTARRLFTVVGGWLGTSLTALAAERFVASRELLLRVPLSDETERAYVWRSPDGRRTWERVDSDADCTDSPIAPQIASAIVQYTAAEDGRVDFYVMLVNTAGASCPPPVAGSEAIATIVVDTRPPLVQVHAAELQTAADEVHVRIALSLIEENLVDGGVRLFYRTAAQARWLDGGPLHVIADTAEWTPPKTLGDTCDLRIVATDRAGNSASSDVFGVRVRAADEHAQLAADAVNVDEPAQKDAETTADIVDDTAGSEPAPAADLAQITNLRRQAARFSSRREFSLAEARLEEALKLDPENVELLAELGRVLLKQKQFAAAQQRFESVLQASPDNRAARAGIAEAFFLQNKYPAAREHLRRLLEMNPDDPAMLLQLGDTEHRLGAADEARRLWQRAGLVAKDDLVRQSAEARLKLLGKGN